MLDIAFVYIAFRIGMVIGYRRGEKDNSPPFWFDKQRKLCAPLGGDWFKKEDLVYKMSEGYARFIL